MLAIHTILSGLTVYKSAVYRNLTLFPLVSSEESTVDYLTLDDALGNNLARVCEISEGGSVSELRFENAANLPVLIVDGEEFVGAKQNRTANLTLLAPAGKTIVIPVSCVEAGRWRYDTDEFVAANRTHFARGRAIKAASVSQSLKRGGRRHADQGRVWHDIEAKACRMEAASPTQAMAAIFDRHRARVDDYVGAFSAVEDQTGALFAIGGEVVGFDLFDRRATLSMMLPKLVRSYAIDAIETAGEESSAVPDVGQVEVFVERAASASVSLYPAVGLGTDIRLTAPGLVGGGLSVDDTLVHLAVFALSEENRGGRSHDRGMASVRARRRSVRRR